MLRELKLLRKFLTRTVLLGGTRASHGDPLNKKPTSSGVLSVYFTVDWRWVSVVLRHGSYVVIYLKTAMWMSLG